MLPPHHLCTQRLILPSPTLLLNIFYCFTIFLRNPHPSGKVTSLVLPPPSAIPYFSAVTSLQNACSTDPNLHNHFPNRALLKRIQSLTSLEERNKKRKAVEEDRRSKERRSREREREPSRDGGDSREAGRDHDRRSKDRDRHHDRDRNYDRERDRNRDRSRNYDSRSRRRSRSRSRERSRDYDRHRRYDRY